MRARKLFGMFALLFLLFSCFSGCSSTRTTGVHDAVGPRETRSERVSSMPSEGTGSVGGAIPGTEPGFEALDRIQSSVYGQEEFSRIDRIEILVESCKARIIGSDQNGTRVIKVFSVATATRGKQSDDLPYGVEGKVYMVALNPKWTPTPEMITRAIAKGQKPPKEILPGAKDNPLGKMKLYFVFSFRGKKITDLGMHATTKAHQAEIRDGRENRLSTGCVRGKDPVITLNMKVFLRQNGKDPDALFARAKAHPGTTINISLTDRPTVVYLRE